MDDDREPLTIDRARPRKIEWKKIKRLNKKSNDWIKNQKIELKIKRLNKKSKDWIKKSKDWMKNQMIE